MMGKCTFQEEPQEGKKVWATGQAPQAECVGEDLE